MLIIRKVDSVWSKDEAWGHREKEQTIPFVPKTPCAEAKVLGKDVSHSSPHGNTENH